MDKPVQAGDLEEVRERFTSWRSNRKGRSSIPEDLWDMVVKLCTKHPISKISAALGLDYTKLKFKVLQARVLSNNSVRERSSFVEVKVPGCGVEEVSGEQKKHTVEFFRADGSRMRIVTGDCVLLNQLSVLFLQSK